MRKMILRFTSLLFVFLFSTTRLYTQEIVDQVELQYDQIPSKIVLNNDRMFTAASIEITNGVYINNYEDGKWVYNDVIYKDNSYDFGYNFDAFDDWLIVGDEQDYSETGEIPRSLYFYQYQDTGWTYKQKFTRDFSYFTQAFSIYGDWAVAGDNYSYPGIDSVYIYHLEGDSWVQTQSIAYDDTTHSYELYPNPGFGEHVKMYGDYFVVVDI